MKTRLLICLMAFIPWAMPLQAGVLDVISTIFTRKMTPQPPAIRVLLAHDQPKVVLEVKGKYHIFDPHTETHIDTGFKGKRQQVEATYDGLRWGEEFPGIHQILIVPDNLETTTVVDGIEYRGKIYVYDVGGGVSVVNQVAIEEYLNATMPKQYPENLPEELMAAITITARTNAYFSAQNSKNPYWDVDANRVGYRGYHPTNRSQDVERAVFQTRYMVLHRIGGGDWEVTPFAAAWRPVGGGKLEKGVIYSKITVEEADKQAQRGATAVQLLQKAFPSTSIQQMHERNQHDT